MRCTRLLILLVIAGCSTVTPQRIELCTNYVLYEDQSAYEAAAPNAYAASKRGRYDRIRNEIHVVKWDLYTAGEEAYHAMRHRGWPEKLIVDEGYEHFE